MTPGRASRVVRAVTVVVASLLALASCSDPQPRTLPPPSSTSSTLATTTTTKPDYSQIELATVPGQTTTSAPIAEGDAVLRGIVLGPDGPVPQAIVRAERLVGDAVQRLDVRAGDDGIFRLAGIPGGRFRVRAFLPPSLTMADAEIFFLADGDERELRLVVEPFSGVAIDAVTTPSSPIVGRGVNLAVRVADRIVDENGVAREVPRAGEAVRVNSSGWTELNGAAAGVTDARGVVVFEYRCDRVGPVTATAVVGAEQQAFPLDVPGCAPVPTTTTTTTTSTTSTTIVGDDGNGNDGDDPATSTTSTTDP